MSVATYIEAYVFNSMRQLKIPIACAGHQGMWNWEPPANLEELYAG